MEIYLGNPGEKLTAWCKANYGKPLPKDPSEGGVWTVTSPAYDQPIKCIKVDETSWRGQISNNKYASVQYSSDSGYTVSYVNDESTGDAMGTIFSDAQFTDTNLQNENITATWSPE